MSKKCRCKNRGWYAVRANEATDDEKRQRMPGKFGWHRRACDCPAGQDLSLQLKVDPTPLRDRSDVQAAMERFRETFVEEAGKIIDVASEMQKYIDENDLHVRVGSILR